METPRYIVFFPKNRVYYGSGDFAMTPDFLKARIFEDRQKALNAALDFHAEKGQVVDYLVARMKYLMEA